MTEEDKRIISNNLFYNYIQYEIADSTKILFINEDLKNDESEEKAFMYDTKTKEIFFSERYLGCCGFQFSTANLKLFLMKKNNIIYFKINDIFYAYKLNKQKKLELILEEKNTPFKKLNWISNGHIENIISNKNFSFFITGENNNYKTSTLYIKDIEEALYCNLYSESIINDNMFNISEKIKLFYKEKILLKTKLDGNIFKINVWTEKNIFKKEFEIKKVLKKSKIEHVEINGNLITTYIEISKNKILKICLNILNGKLYCEENIKKIYYATGRENILEEKVDKKITTLKFKNKIILKTKEELLINYTRDVIKIKKKEKEKTLFFEQDFNKRKILDETNIIFKTKKINEINLLFNEEKIYIRHKSFKDSEIKVDNINFFNEIFNYKNLLLFRTIKKNFFIYDAGKRKILFPEYFLLPQETIVAQMEKFAKQTNFERMKTNILNSTMIRQNK